MVWERSEIRLANDASNRLMISGVENLRSFLSVCKIRDGKAGFAVPMK